MSRDRDPYERTLDILRRRLRAGAFGEGRHLQIQNLAQDLAVSSTPVREALSRLLGEGLIERGPGGYFSPRHDISSLGDLYRLDETYALTALRRADRPKAPAPQAPPSPETCAGALHLARTEALLTRLGGVDDRALLWARRNLWDRLAPFRAAEVAVFDDLEAEAAAVDVALTAERGRNILGLIRFYYRRRLKSVRAILQASRARIYHSNIP